jgi:uncharacterized protein YkwD
MPSSIPPGNVTAVETAAPEAVDRGTVSGVVGNGNGSGTPSTAPDEQAGEVLSQQAPVASPGAAIVAPSDTGRAEPSATSSLPGTTAAPSSLTAGVVPPPAANRVASLVGPADEVVALTNAERAQAGCGALAIDARLTAAAQAHSVDMAINNYFDHISLDGQTPFQRIAAAGYTFSVAAENIAGGQRTPRDVVAGWMNSAGHRANILNCSLSQIGVGFATGGSYGTYWTQDFGSH